MSPWKEAIIAKCIYSTDVRFADTSEGVQYGTRGNGELHFDSGEPFSAETTMAFHLKLQHFNQLVVDSSSYSRCKWRKKVLAV